MQAPVGGVGHERDGHGGAGGGDPAWEGVAGVGAQQRGVGVRAVVDLGGFDRGFRAPNFWLCGSAVETC